MQVTISGAAHTITTGYDGAGRVNAVTYPSGFAVAYAYNALGYQTQLTNSATQQVYWTANARDAELQLTQQTAGNGVVTTRSFHAQSGRLTGIQAGNGGAVQAMSFGYDLIGNLTSRSDSQYRAERELHLRPAQPADLGDRRGRAWRRRSPTTSIGNMLTSPMSAPTATRRRASRGRMAC